MERQKTEEIFTAIDDLTAKLHATLDSGKTVAKSLVMALLERCNAPSQTAEAASELLTVKEVAQLMRVSPNSIYQWVDNKGFPALRAGEDLRFDKQSVIEWMKQHRKKSQSAHLHMVKSQPTPMRLQPVKGAK